jgi:hypothetical protein
MVLQVHIFLLLLAYNTYQILSKNLENELFVKLFHKTISQLKKEKFAS